MIKGNVLKRVFRGGRRSFMRNNSRMIRKIRKSNVKCYRVSLVPRDMFCYQCEQTNEGKGCVTIGVCGKTEPVSRLQDLLIYLNKGISQYCFRASKLGVRDEELDRWIIESNFSTLTNVNFDDERFLTFVKMAMKYKDRAAMMYEKACKSKGIKPDKLSGPATFKLTNFDLDHLVNTVSPPLSIPTRQNQNGDDIVGLQELITYGIKGTSAYADHARLIGKEDPTIYADIHKVYDFLTKENPSVDELLEYASFTGNINFRVMELLDRAATDRWGHPEPTQVKISPVAGKCILVSGHDIVDLEMILKQTEGTGINVYTHGELLPANAYPALKKYKHLVGNYGGAWQLQKLEFSMFPGPIVMTTNCITEPKKRYKNRIFTRSVVGWPGVEHIEGNDFSKVIQSARDCEGFLKDEKLRTITIGFARNTVLSVAEQVVEGVKNGAIKHFFLIGGCDGAELERDYFTQVANNVPLDSVILTLACGKYRFNTKDFGTIGGIPRLLDVGQCNDAYSAIQIATALAKAFNTDVNSLPLSLVISWFEQKAVAVLLTLLHLNLKGIYLGPNLPAFCTPNMLAILSEKYGLRQIGDAKKDVQDMLAKC